VFTFSGTLKDNTPGNLVITVSNPTGLSSGSVTIKVYYHATNSSTNPNLCSTDSGTSINSSGVSTVSCSIPTGTYYLYIKLSNDNFTNLSVSSSTIYVTSDTRFRYIKDTGITISQGTVSNLALGSFYAAYTLTENGTQFSYLKLTVVVDGRLFPASGPTTIIAVAGNSPSIIFNTVGRAHVTANCNGQITETCSIDNDKNTTMVFTASAFDTSGSLLTIGSVATFAMRSTGGTISVQFHASVLSAVFIWSNVKMW
jgi:hypothetical protein